MTETKRPRAGEWWETKSGNMRACFDTVPSGQLVVVYSDGETGLCRDDSIWAHWRHLPDCDSFAWKPKSEPKLKRVAVRLWVDKDVASSQDALIVRCCRERSMVEHVEIKSDKAGGWYIDVPE